MPFVSHPTTDLFLFAGVLLTIHLFHVCVYMCIFTCVYASWYMCFCMCMSGKEMFNLTTDSTHFIYSYMMSDIWYHSDSERGNPLLPQRLLFVISSKGSFICIIPQTG